MTTKCISCGKKAKTTRHKTYKYIESGLDNVYLNNVVTETRCQKCGEHYVNFGDIDKHHEQIASLLVGKNGPLSGREVRFLRTHVGVKGALLAKQLRKEPETIYRIEASDLVNKDFDILFRLWYAMSNRDSLDYDIHDKILSGPQEGAKKIYASPAKSPVRFVEASP